MTGDGVSDPTLVDDLAAILAGLQVPLSLMNGASLGAARDPYLRVRDRLRLFGWVTAADAAKALAAALGDPDGLG